MTSTEKIKKFNEIINTLKEFKIDFSYNSTLYNMGNTCYMNSVIQSLVSNDNLLNLLFNKNTIGNMRISINNDNISFENNNTNIYFQFLLLIKGILEESCIVKPVSFKNWIGKLNSDFEGLEQHDSHEFLNTIIDLLNHGLKTDFNLKITHKSHPSKLEVSSRSAWQRYFENEYSPIIDLFYGLYYNCIICNNCKNKSHNFEPFNSIILDIPDIYDDNSSVNSEDNPTENNNSNNENEHNKNITLIDCFDYTFKDEKFENTNLYYCDKCKTLNQAIKKHYIWKLPENLIIVFKRFNGLDKDNTHITFDINNLNLNKYTYNNNNINYNLYSTINHFGNILGGHYINISKRDNKWYIFDDDKRQDLNNTELFYTNSYILFYK